MDWRRIFRNNEGIGILGNIVLLAQLLYRVLVASYATDKVQQLVDIGVSRGEVEVCLQSLFFVEPLLKVVHRAVELEVTVAELDLSGAQVGTLGAVGK